MNKLHLFHFCQKYGLMTYATNEQYNRLMFIVERGGTFKEIAIAIFMCSDTEMTLDDLVAELKKYSKACSIY